MRLYEYHGLMAALFANGVDEETGEMPEDFEQQLTELHIDFERKAIDIGLFVRHCEAEEEIFKKQEEYFKKKRQAAAKKAERLTNYLAANVPQEVTIKDPAGRISIGWRKSKFVQVPNLSPSDHLELMQTLKAYEVDDVVTVTEEYKLNKTNAKKLIETNADVAIILEAYEITLEERQNLQLK